MDKKKRKGVTNSEGASGFPPSLDFISTEDLSREIISRTECGIILFCPRGKVSEVSYSVGDAMSLIGRWVSEKIEEDE